MPHLPGPPRPHVRQLLDALADPASCANLEAAAWDLLVRTARSARLLGTLAVRLEGGGLKIAWTGAGTLEQAGVVTGPYTNAPSQTNPQTIPVTAPAMFYRLKQ